MKLVRSFWEGVSWAEQGESISHDDKFNSFSWFFVLTEVLHDLEAEPDLQIHLVFKCLDNLLGDSCLLQIVIVYEYVGFICVHDNEPIVSAFVKKF